MTDLVTTVQMCETSLYDTVLWDPSLRYSSQVMHGFVTTFREKGGEKIT